MSRMAVYQSIKPQLQKTPNNFELTHGRVNQSWFPLVLTSTLRPWRPTRLGQQSLCCLARHGACQWTLAVCWQPSMQKRQQLQLHHLQAQLCMWLCHHLCREMRVPSLVGVTVTAPVTATTALVALRTQSSCPHPSTDAQPVQGSTAVHHMP